MSEQRINDERPLPCPECGGVAAAKLDPREGEAWAVQCDEFECWTGPTFEDERRAVTAWNNLVGSAAASEAETVERIAKWLENMETSVPTNPETMPGVAAAIASVAQTCIRSLAVPLRSGAWKEDQR